MAAQGSILGNSVLRREDPALLTGADTYYDDMKLDGLVYVHFVRSPFAHATIDGIDTAEATGMPGVVAVYTAENLEIPDFQGFPMFPAEFNRPVLAKGKVRFVGDMVAAVVAESREAAADAAEAVVVDYSPLPVLTDIEKALDADAPVLFDEVGANMVMPSTLPAEGYDEAAPLEGADRVVEVKMISQRLAGVPMEPNGIVAIPDGDSMEAWVSSQAPITMKEVYAPMCGIEADNLRVAAPPAVGGGFGPKAAPYCEHFVAIKAAQALGRPVKWTEERSENMLSMLHGRAMVLTAKLGLTNEGKFTGIDVEVIADCGAYPGIGGVLPTLTQMMIQGVYDIPKIRYRSSSVVTNSTTIGAYRGAGRPEATQILERVIDAAAHELDIDPAEIRRMNFLQPDAFPLTTLSGANYDSGEYEAALDAALAASDYQNLRSQQAERRSAGDAKQLGIGLSSYVEVTAPIGLHVEFGAIEVHTDGTVSARVGTSAHGQGHLTAFSMIVSDMLGVPMENVKLLQSDTDHIPRGAGTMGSRSLQTAGSALHVASETVLAKAKTLAAHLLEANEDDIVVGDGGLQVAGTPASNVSWGDLAAAANDDSKRPDGMEPGLAHELDFDGQDSTYPFGTHVSVVEVDTETGQVEMLRHFAVDDCGKILNPMLVTGQQHGGIAQGAAQALYEIVAYDEDGNPITSNLMDYAIPSAAELPSFDASNTETPSPRNPMGAKGIGESGTIGSTPAIHNAVIDAVSHLGVKHIDMPLSAQTVWAAIQAAR